MRRSALLLLPLILLAAVPSLSQGQELLEVEARIGRQWNPYQRYSAGATGALGLTLFPWPDRLTGFRLEGMVMRGRYSYFGILPGEDPAAVEPRQIDFGVEPTLVARLTVLVREEVEDAPFQGYVYAGLAFTQLPWTERGVSRQDFGPAGGLGLGSVGRTPEVMAEIGFLSRFDQRGLRVIATASIGLRLGIL